MSKGKRLELWTVEDFEKLYKIVKIHPERKRKRIVGREEAAKFFGVSVVTIDKALEISKYSPPSAHAKFVLPKVVMEFYESEALQKIKGHKYEAEIKATLRLAWEALGRIEPMTWNPDMMRELRTPTVNQKPNPLYKFITKDIDEHHASNLRRFIKACFRGDAKDLLMDELEDVKGAPHGVRLHWYLDDSDIAKLFGSIDTLDVMVYSTLGLTCGGRPGSLADSFADKKLTLTTDKIDRKRHTIMRWESKVGQWCFPKYQDWIFDLIERYISIRKIPYGEKLLPHDQGYYGQKIREAGLRAGIERFQTKGAGAYILRHTFATKAAEHGVSLEVIMLMGGWLDASTIKAFYMAIPETKIEREILGLHKDALIDWNTYINQFREVIERRFNESYEELQRAKEKKKLEIKPKPEPKPKKEFKGYNWEAIKKSAESPKTPENLKKGMRKLLDLHEKGMTDQQIHEVIKK